MRSNTFSTLALSLSLMFGGLAAATPAMAKDSVAQVQAMVAQTKVTLAQAVQAALAVVPGKALDAQLDDDKGQVRYEVEIITPQGHSVEVWVNATTGVAVQHEDDGPAKRKERERLEASKITLLQAIAAAQKHTPGTVVDAELSNDWGQTAFAVDVLTAKGRLMEVKLSPEDGRVLRSKPD